MILFGQLVQLALGVNMKIAIPTHNRKEITTLELLSAFNTEDIYLFVNDAEQAELHKDCQVVITGTKGIQNARNAILDYFEEDEHVLMLDDDIEKFETLRGGVKNGSVKKNLTEMSPLEIKEFVEHGFEVCERNKAKLWGIYPVYNPFYMSMKLNNSGFIIGSFAGIINNPIRFRTDLPLKEDYAYTLDNIIKYKKVVRFDYVTMKIRHYTNAGGCVETRKDNEDLERICCEKLLKMYPRMLKPNPSRENEVLITI